MGLDTSHDAFHGAYSAFNSLRQEVAHAIGGSYGPHWLRTHHGEIARDKDGYPIRDETLNDAMFYVPDEITEDAFPGLWEFLRHSDCDGEISPEMCMKVADDLDHCFPRCRRAARAISRGAAGTERCCGSSSRVAGPPLRKASR